MCEAHKCQHPERLKGESEKCSPEQVFECHGRKEERSDKKS